MRARADRASSFPASCSSRGPFSQRLPLPALFRAGAERQRREATLFRPTGTSSLWRRCVSPASATAAGSSNEGQDRSRPCRHLREVRTSSPPLNSRARIKSPASSRTPAAPSSTLGRRPQRLFEPFYSTKGLRHGHGTVNLPLDHRR
jgi:hypothetical protein